MIDSVFRWFHLQWVDLADDERGDVPGWVLITLMTAGLVVLVWSLAGPALTSLFEDAISSVGRVRAP